ncbi:MAG: hypothetical protein RL095_336 [Verrucomicrobiota bacterium]|jgi:thiol-disulfide isomerase/thioredoxin
MYISTLLCLPLFLQSPAPDSQSATPPASVTAPPATPKQPLGEGSDAPALNLNKWLQGESIDKLDPKGTYIIECWASWCPPCIDSLPRLNQIAKDFKGKIQILAVNVWDKPEAAQKFLAKHGKSLSFPIAYGGANETSPFARSWLVPAGIEGIPSAFVVHQGKIAAILHPELLSKEMLEALAANDTARFKSLYEEDRLVEAEEEEGEGDCEDEAEEGEDDCEDEAQEGEGEAESVFNISRQVAILGLENVLSGLAFTLKASDKNYQAQPESFSFHEPTGLLYFRGSEAQLELIEKALKELAKAEKPEPSGESEEASGDPAEMEVETEEDEAEESASFPATKALQAAV